MAAVIEGRERINEVQIEGLALMKIVKHCHDALPHMANGSLLGLAGKNGILEITHAFPFPMEGKATTTNQTTTSNTAESDNDEPTSNIEGQDFQLEMMRMLREVNVDNNCVGWYQSMYLGIFSTSALLENQISYQTDLSPNAVVMLYDPMQTSHGKLVLKCIRLTDEVIQIKNNNKNTYINPKDIFEEIPIKLTNPGLAQVLLSDITDGVHIASSTGENGLYDPNAEITFDRLDLSTNPYLEKHLEFLCGWVDDLATEQQKFQYYARQISRGNNTGKDNRRNKNKKEDNDVDTAAAWSSTDAPRRMESLLIANQIRNYCDQMDTFTTGGLGKLYLAGGLHK